MLSLAVWHEREDCTFRASERCERAWERFPNNTLIDLSRARLADWLQLGKGNRSDNRILESKYQSGYAEMEMLLGDLS